MKVSRRVLITGAGLVVAAATAVAAPTPVAAAITTTAVASPSTAAANSAAALVSGKPSYLQSSAGESFVQGSVISSNGIQYVPYNRTFKGLPVVGGDFVIATNSAGQVVAHSVAMEHPIGALATAPKLSQTSAEAVAAKQFTTVSTVEGVQLVVHALGSGAARLAWETTMRGTGAEGYSRLTVDVDALTGKVLRTQEHVMHGAGDAAWNGPNPVTIATTNSGGAFRM